MISVTALFAWCWCECRKKLNNIGGENKKLQAQEIAFAVLAFLPMYLINSCMRYVGNDYEVYFTYYQNIVSGKEQDVDIAYKVVCKLSAWLGWGFQGTYFIFCIMAYLLLLLCIRKYSKNYAVSYLLFFFSGLFGLLGLNQIRQFVAVMLVFYAYDYIENKKLLKYLICVFFAYTFHFSAIVMIPFYWILTKKWKLSVYAIVSIVLLPINFFYNDVMVWLFANFMPKYLNTNFATREFSIEIPYLGVILGTMLICMLFEPNGKEDKYTIIFKNNIYITSILAVFGSWIPEYKRFIYYFFITSIVYITRLVEKENNKWRKFIVYGIVIVVYAWYLFRTNSNWGILPYQSIFSANVGV